MTKFQVGISIFSAVCFLVLNVSAAQKDESKTQTSSLSRVVEHIMRYQERKTGILYPSLPPNVRIANANELNYSAVAEYKVLFKEILLHNRYSTCNFDYLADNLENVVSSETEPCNLVEIRTVLSHELGHFLTHTYIKQYVPDSWLAPYFAQEIEPGPTIFGEYMIVEGIGEYFGCLFGPCSTPIAKEAWTRHYAVEEFHYPSMLTFFFYSGGYDIVKEVMDTQGAKDGIRWLLEHKLKITLPDIKEGLSYRNQGTFNTRPDTPEQEERKQIINSVLPDLKAKETNILLKECENVSILTLRKLNELARLRREAWPEYAPVSPSYLDEWFYLIEHNASLLGLASMDEYHLPPMVREFRQGRVPLEFIALISGMRWEYPRAIAKQDLDCAKDIVSNCEQLHKILLSQEHTYRTEDEGNEIQPDYSETPDQALKIKDQTTVILVKLFAEYVLSDRGRHELSALIRASANSNEEGGVFVWNEQGITLIPIPNTLTSKRENGWNPPLVHGYANVFGSVHTHPLTEDIDPQALAGPSGSAKMYFADDSSDLNALRYYTRMGNPYMMWAIVTALSKTTYNVDLYFRDLEPLPNNSKRVHSTKELTVLDIGNFKVVD